MINNNPCRCMTAMGAGMVQRWLDFLMAQDLPSRDMATFLLRSPEPVFTSCTQGQALQVLSYLKNLGVKQVRLL